MLRALRRITVSGVALAMLFSTQAVASAAPSLEQSVRLANHDPGSTVDDADVAVALDHVGHDYGTRIDDGDRQWLISWADDVSRVIQTAHDQIGDPYRWGAAGPDAFDCSGLTLYSWRAAGVSLPHSSRSQAGITRSVSRSDLLPGDLIFYGNPVHHVAVYVGGGQAIDAPRSGYNVREDGEMVHRGDIVKFGRVNR